jgi:hypothetical protein
MSNPFVFIDVDLRTRELRGQFVPTDDDLAVGVEVSIDVFECAVGGLWIELLNPNGEHMTTICD